MQSKKMSLVESLSSTAVGFMVSVVLVNVVLPFYGFKVSYAQSIEITVIFTVASVLRGYFIRRFFNFLHKTT